MPDTHELVEAVVERPDSESFEDLIEGEVELPVGFLGCVVANVLEFQNQSEKNKSQHHFEVEGEDIHKEFQQTVEEDSELQFGLEDDQFFEEGLVEFGCEEEIQFAQI